MEQNTSSRTGWLFVLVTVLIPVALWISIEPVTSRFGSAYDAFGSLGKLSGLISLTLFCVNMILTTRLRFLENWFGGLNKLFIAHHVTGGLALLVLLIHPLALALQRMTYSPRDAALFLLPSFDNTAIVIGRIALLLFLAQMVVSFYLKLPYRLWLLSHKFLGVVLLLIGLHVILISTDLDANIPLLLYSLFLLLAAGVSFIYRTLMPRFLVRRYAYTIAQAKDLGHRVLRLKLAPKGRQLSFRPGQFVFVSFQADFLPKEWHPFSISGSHASGTIELTIKNLGLYTNMLHMNRANLKNTEVLVEGAYGRFSFRNFKSRRQIWIAGGIGITPFLAMLGDIPEGYRVDLYHSVRSDAELIDREEIERMAAQSKGKLRFIPHTTDEQGYFGLQVIMKHSADMEGAEILLCGPRPMMHAMKAQLARCGVPKRKIHTEEFVLS